jgi:hypothetical protein
MELNARKTAWALFKISVLNFRFGSCGHVIAKSFRKETIQHFFSSSYLTARHLL